ncbi:MULTISPECIES: putative quinol monooxygenase [Streptomyces]|uniref:Antibiotic biosynthesis monooxygenase n=1 Tax=Streptomyces chartreusis NRRL 3882 TaxID=1079985 RepID=A0A2N9B0N1_STRCX|nr:MULTISPECIES: putative quinol monooxygenase [Streptomyces]MYS90909.1 antibiotic biosynthesis monooxygenase [Streptomyces sp. SID5464]SOR76887.1 Antibiotic biosynthesis monooxygenase [Streptomyces chartreusis NRRL 3882]
MAEEIIVAGWMDYEAGDRDRVLGHLVVLGDRTREEEPGCLDYAMTADPGSEQRIRVYERWASRQALDEHFATPHIKEFRAAVAGITRVGVCLEAHTVASSRPMR